MSDFPEPVNGTVPWSSPPYATSEEVFHHDQIPLLGTFQFHDAEWLFARRYVSEDLHVWLYTKLDAHGRKQLRSAIPRIRDVSRLLDEAESRIGHSMYVLAHDRSGIVGHFHAGKPQDSAHQLRLLLDDVRKGGMSLSEDIDEMLKMFEEGTEAINR